MWTKLLIYCGILCIMFITTTTSIVLGIKQVVTASFFLIGLAILKKEFLHKDFIFINKNKVEIQYLLIIFIAAIFQVLQNDLSSFFNTMNSFFLPIILLLFLTSLSDSTKNNIYKLILFFFIVECILAIFERIYNINIFPETVTEGDVLNINIQNDWEFRSSSLWGNPLMNANIVSIILAFIIISKINLKKKIFFYLIGIFSFFAFNARGAAIIWAGLSVPFFLLNYRKINRKYKAIYLVGTLVVLLFISYVLLNSSWGGRLLNQEKIIDGSAMVRAEAFDVFDKISFEDLIYGGVRQDFFTENGYINILLRFGAIQGILIIFFQILITLKHIKKYLLIDKIFILVSFLGVGLLNNNLQQSGPFLFFILCVTSFQSININAKNRNINSNSII